MTIEAFAQRYGLRVRRDSCGDPIIPGRLAYKEIKGIIERSAARRGVKPRPLWDYTNHIYDYGGGKFGVAFFMRTATGIFYRVKAATAGGFVEVQSGGAEAMLTFDPTIEEQARLAIKLVGAKRIRVLSDAQRRAIEKARQSSPLQVRKASAAAGS